jgi:hypothetical protein
MSIYIHKNGRKCFIPRVEKLNGQKNFPEKVEDDAQVDLKKIFAVLQLPESNIPNIMDHFRNIHPKIKPKSKLRNPSKLLPGIIFKYFKDQTLPISSRNLIQHFDVSRKEFNESLKEIYKYFSNFSEAHEIKAHRIKILMKMMFSITEQFKMPMVFYHDMRDILQGLWKHVKYSTDNVIVAIVASITSYCYYNGELTVREISAHIGIDGSSVTQIIKKNFVEKFKIKGYKRLPSSSHLLREFLEKLVFNFSKQVRIIKKREQKMINA